MFSESRRKDPKKSQTVGFEDPEDREHAKVPWVQEERLESGSVSARRARGNFDIIKRLISLELSLN
jgi:hypothetical protein